MKPQRIVLDLDATDDPVHGERNRLTPQRYQGAAGFDGTNSNQKALSL